MKIDYKYTIQIQAGLDGSWQEISGFFTSEISANTYIKRILADLSMLVCLYLYARNLYPDESLLHM